MARLLPTLPLSSRFALFFAGTLLTTALAVFLSLSLMAIHQSEHQAELTVKLASQMLSRLLRTQATGLMDQGRFVGSSLGQMILTPHRATVDDSLREIEVLLRVDAAVLVAREGAFLGGREGLLEETRTQAHWPTQGAQSGIFVVQNRPRLVVNIPITDPASREVQGALYLYRDLDSTLAQELADALQARVVFYLDNTAYAFSRLLPLAPGEETDYVKTRAGLPDDWTEGRFQLQVSLPRSTLLADLGRERELVLVVFLATCALGLALAVRWGRSLTLPLEQVVDAAQQVRQGHWPEPLTSARQEELRLLQDVFNEMTGTLRTNQRITIETLAAAVDARDAYTRGHSERVARYAQRLALALKLPQEVAERVHLVGILHDLGKIAIPDAILLKPDALEDDERRMMESHPVRSEELVRKVPLLAATLPGIRHHHERWDGRGYPDGLAGEAIPLDARLIALADSFDALTSDRPYRKGRTIPQALEELERCSGTQFDPALVAPFKALWQDAAGEAREPQGEPTPFPPQGS